MVQKGPLGSIRQTCGRPVRAVGGTALEGWLVVEVERRRARARMLVMMVV